MSKIFIVLTIAYKELYYTSETILLPGDIVLVPVRNRKVLGIVIGEYNQEINYQLKNISEVFPFKLNESLLDFINLSASHCLVDKGAILKMILGPFTKRYKTIVKKIPLTVDFSGNDIELSDEQQKVFNHMLEINNGVTVLDGVTGSGKTELYLQIAKSIIDKDGQVLILLPEILLTSQIIERAKKFFHLDSWHSSVKQKDKDLVWLGVQFGITKAVIGARSALFLPFKNLKMIIIDEEHDSSFKQENPPIYHARSLALLLGQILNIPVMLISATPSIDTLYNVKNGNYSYFNLTRSHHKNAKTSISIANMWEVYDKSTKISPILHPNTVKALGITLQNKKQSIVFLNRKGYAATTVCIKCMTTVKCKNCDIKLTYYKYRNYMKCRYCSYIMRESPICTVCNCNDYISSYQPGTEKLYEEIKNHFPEARIFLVTKDSEESAIEIIDKIMNDGCDIIIGTQILAKGLHFPNIALSVIVDANNTRFSGDIRSLEKTYQIIQQVIGRVGREDNGTAIIQTFTPNLPLIKAIVSGNKDEFINLELENRKTAKVPPYSHFVLIHITSLNEKRLLDWLKNIDIPLSNSKFKVFGPMPAAINRLHNKYRQQIIFKGDINISKIVTHWIASLKIPHFITLIADVDPINFY